MFCPTQRISFPAPAAPAAPRPGQPPCLPAAQLGLSWRREQSHRGSGKEWCLGAPSCLLSLAVQSASAVYPHTSATSAPLKARSAIPFPCSGTSTGHGESALNSSQRHVRPWPPLPRHPSLCPVLCRLLYSEDQSLIELRVRRILKGQLIQSLKRLLPLTLHHSVPSFACEVSSS